MKKIIEWIWNKDRKGITKYKDGVVHKGNNSRIIIRDLKSENRKDRSQKGIELFFKRLHKKEVKTENIVRCVVSRKKVSMIHFALSTESAEALYRSLKVYLGKEDNLPFDSLKEWMDDSVTIEYINYKFTVNPDEEE